MKTIKTKKSVGKAYVFSYTLLDGRTCSVSSMDKEGLEKSRKLYDKPSVYTISEISEVELFEGVEEQVPQVVERYYFVVSGDTDDGIHTRKKKDLAELEELRNEFVNQGFDCSEIKLLREEF